ncbi:MAG TPA: hypothetical protein PLO89_10425 [Spirochaetota bacterium]|nr:hypothetical protein [Spirochaetota bacterium]
MAKKAAKTSNVDLQQFLSEIEKRAYEIYIERKTNHVTGDEVSDWLKAEEDIKTKYKI